MAKSKLGIPVTIAAALIYLMGGIASLWVMGALIIFVLIMEEDGFLRTAAKEAASLLLIFALVNLSLELLSRLVFFIASIAGREGDLSMFITVVIWLERIVLLYCAIQALRHRLVKINFFPVRAELTDDKASRRADDADKVYCQKCGKPSAAGLVFCKHCGARLPETEDSAADDENREDLP